MNQSQSCSNDISVINQESKINGKIDTIEGQLSFMGEGETEKPRSSPSKEESSFSLFPKKLEDNQDTQDGLRETDLPNGHNNPDAVDITPRTKSLDELLKESEELPDTELIGCTKEFVESKMDTTHSSENLNSNDQGVAKKEENNIKEVDTIDTGSSKDEKDLKKKPEELLQKEIKKDDLRNVTEKNINIEKSETSRNDNSSVPDHHESLENKTTEIKKDKKCEDKSVSEKEESTNKEDSFSLDISNSQFIHVSPPTDEEEKEDKSAKEKEIDDKRNELHDNSNEDENQENLSEKEEEILDSDTLPEDYHCSPECHKRMKLIKMHLGNVSKQLDGYIKLKKQEELANVLKLIGEIELLAENKKHEVSQELLNDAFQEENGILKKRKSRPTSKALKADVSISKKEVPTKRSKKGGHSSQEDEPMSEINFKNLKGLAVFAKWPNSGWYYPGIIEGFTNSDWKEATNVKVKFYDGLVREMKNINILPAHLIPASSIVSDLDDETDMTVLSTNSIDNNCVEFSLSSREESGKNLEMNFNKLAIKALHMKSIKQQLEPNVNASAKKMHMVSLDNLVSGRRSRIRTAKVEEDESSETTPRKYARKSIAPGKVSIQSSEESASNTVTTPIKTYANKRGTTPKRTPSKRMKN